MRTVSQQHQEEIRVIADLNGHIDHDRLLKMRAEIDRMRSLNLRLVALAMWYEKVRISAR
jgi:hypothetical protein